MSTETRSGGRPSRVTEDSRRGKLNWRLILSLILLAMIIIFSLMNAQEVAVNLLVATLTTPMFVIIFGSAIIGGIITFLATMWQRNHGRGVQ